MRKHSLRLFLALLSVLLLTACASQREARERTGEPASGFSIWKYLDRHQKAWLFSYFTGDGDGLHLAYSYDGLIWRALNQGQPLLRPEVGQARLLRDPSIVQGPDGTFHMVWTTGWTEKGIGYASSKDLIHWSEQQEIPVMAQEPEARNTWAPELFYNKGTYYIVWASTIPGRFPMNGTAEDGYNHRLYYTKTKDFKTFSPTALFYDPGFNVIDACFIKEGSKYYMFLKNETLEPVEKNIRMAVSGKLENFPASFSDPLTGQEGADGCQNRQVHLSLLGQIPQSPLWCHAYQKTGQGGVGGHFRHGALSRGNATWYGFPGGCLGVEEYPAPDGAQGGVG